MMGSLCVGVLWGIVDCCLGCLLYWNCRYAGLVFFLSTSVRGVSTSGTYAMCACVLMVN